MVGLACSGLGREEEVTRGAGNKRRRAEALPQRGTGFSAKPVWIFSATGNLQDWLLSVLASVSSVCKVASSVPAQSKYSVFQESCAPCPSCPQLLRTGTCQPPSLPQCQQLTSCRPCTRSRPSCSAWRWSSSSGCMPITRCTVCRYLPRRTTTGTVRHPWARSEGVP